MKICVLTISILSMVFGCGSDENSAPLAEQHQSEGCMSSEMLLEWKMYLESTDDGLWEGDSHKSVVYNSTAQYCDTSGQVLEVFRPSSFCEYDDNVYIADAATFQIIACDSNGSVLWRTGGRGEGPGHFTMMTSIAAVNNYIFALNPGLSRIEVFHRETGEYSHSFPFIAAEDIIALNDSTIAVGSRMGTGGDICVLDVEGDILKEFGETETVDYYSIPRSDLMRLCADDSGRICIYNRYEGLLAIYDIESEACLFRGSRTYPATPEPPREMINEDGEKRLVFFPIGGNAYTGPHGAINIIICNIMQDGTFISDPTYLDYAPITAVDRYDWEGNYLDSYCLPDSCINRVLYLPDGRIIARNYVEGSIKIFSNE